MSSPTCNVCVTAVDGQAGFLIAKLLLREEKFSKSISSLTGLTLKPAASKVSELEKLGAKIFTYQPGWVRSVVQNLKKISCDTICLVPPAHQDKLDLTMELISAAQKAGVSNVLLISSAGAEHATKEKQPRLREFVELDSAVLSAKGNPDVALGHSPCVIRAGFVAENLVFYPVQQDQDGNILRAILPLPIGHTHRFAPVTLGDVAQVAAHVLSGKGKHGFDYRHRGQMLVVTGPQLCTGKELAEAGSKGLDWTLEYEDISEAEAKRNLGSLSGVDPFEVEHILEYYSLVREGKPNYISTMAFHDVTGTHPTEPEDFLRIF